MNRYITIQQNLKREQESIRILSRTKATFYKFVGFDAVISNFKTVEINACGLAQIFHFKL